MIKAIGYNRVVLILFFAFFAALSFLYRTEMLAPTLKKQQRQLASSVAETAEMTANLNKLKEGLKLFEKQRHDFEEVQKLGFFDQQNRVSTRQRIVAMQRESRLISARYVVKPAISVRNDKLRDVGYKILKTDIDFNLEAIEDADVYKFIYMLNYGFPGQLIIDDFSLAREKEVTQPLLRKIGVGQSEAIIRARLSVSWQTIVPDETLTVSGGNNKNGGGVK